MQKNVIKFSEWKGRVQMWSKRLSHIDNDRKPPYLIPKYTKKRSCATLTKCLLTYFDNGGTNHGWRALRNRRANEGKLVCWEDETFLHFGLNKLRSTLVSAVGVFVKDSLVMDLGSSAAIKQGDYEGSQLSPGITRVVSMS